MLAVLLSIFTILFLVLKPQLNHLTPKTHPRTVAHLPLVMDLQWECDTVFNVCGMSCIIGQSSGKTFFPSFLLG